MIGMNWFVRTQSRQGRCGTFSLLDVRHGTSSRDLVRHVTRRVKSLWGLRNVSTSCRSVGPMTGGLACRSKRYLRTPAV